MELATIEFSLHDRVLWKMDDINLLTCFGIAIGGEMCLLKLLTSEIITFEEFNKIKYTIILSNKKQINGHDLRRTIGETSVNEAVYKNIISKERIMINVPRKCTILLKYKQFRVNDNKILRGDDMCNIYEFNKYEEFAYFIQGIITSINSYLIPGDEIILSCPIIDGIDYSIEGLKLPILPKDDDEAEKEYYVYPNI
jgi:hypothetical protein